MSKLTTWESKCRYDQRSTGHNLNWFFQRSILLTSVSSCFANIMWYVYYCKDLGHSWSGALSHHHHILLQRFQWNNACVRHHRSEIFHCSASLGWADSFGKGWHNFTKCYYILCWSIMPVSQVCFLAPTYFWWLKLYLQHADANVSMVLVANKCDLESSRVRATRSLQYLMVYLFSNVCIRVLFCIVFLFPLFPCQGGFTRRRHCAC